MTAPDMYGSEHLDLTSDDRRLLDALVEHEFEPRALEPLSDADRRRVRALMSVFGLLRDYPVDDASDTLVHATLARIDRIEDQRSARLRFDEATEVARGGGRRRLRLPDFISVAAVLLIAAGVLWPIFRNMRQSSLDAACQNNLRVLGYAFNRYASDHNGALPMSHAGIFTGWSPKHHNTVNLKPLLEGGYCDHGHLDCPGHSEGDDSYSYQWQSPNRRQPAWGSGRTSVVLGDSNPIIDAMRNGRHMPPLSLSVNHGGRGQNVLLSDSSFIWLRSPMIGREDNIWLINGHNTLRAGDKPLDDGDTFLAH